MKGTSIPLWAALLAVAACGLLLAAFRVAGEGWLAATQLAARFALAAAVVGAALARGGARGFWLGFAVFGLQFSNLPNWMPTGSDDADQLAGTLARLAHPSVSGIPMEALEPMQRGGGVVVGQSDEGRVRTFTVDPGGRAGRAAGIARVALGLLYSAIGGLVGWRFASARNATAGAPVAG